MDLARYNDCTAAVPCLNKGKIKENKNMLLNIFKRNPKPHLCALLDYIHHCTFEPNWTRHTEVAANNLISFYQIQII